MRDPATMLDVPAQGGAWQFAALWRWSSPSQIEELVLVSAPAEVPTAELAEHPMLIARHVINSRLFIGKRLAPLHRQAVGLPGGREPGRPVALRRPGGGGGPA